MKSQGSRCVRGICFLGCYVSASVESICPAQSSPGGGGGGEGGGLARQTQKHTIGSVSLTRPSFLSSCFGFDSMDQREGGKSCNSGVPISVYFS